MTHRTGNTVGKSRKMIGVPTIHTNGRIDIDVNASQTVIR